MAAGFGERAIQEVTAFGDRELFSATLAPLVSPRTNRFSRSLRFEKGLCVRVWLGVFRLMCSLSGFRAAEVYASCEPETRGKRAIR